MVYHAVCNTKVYPRDITHTHNLHRAKSNIETENNRLNYLLASKDISIGRTDRVSQK